MAYQLFIGYLLQKFDSFVDVFFLFVIITIFSKVNCFSFFLISLFLSLSHLHLKLVDKFMYLGSCVSESDLNMRLGKARTVIDRLLIIWKSDLLNKIKLEFFQVVVVSKLLFGCRTWTLTKCISSMQTGCTLKN